MSITTNKALVRRYLDEVVNGNDLAVADELFAADCVNHLPGSPEPLRGPAGEKMLATMFREGFPDAQITVEDMVAEGDRVASRLTFRGTHRGTFQGIPPTSRTFTMAGMHIARLAEGKIVETWPLPDLLGLLQQIGAIPASAPAGA
jgi:steroid delta-isomerase-like uncharacterized protein